MNSSDGNISGQARVEDSWSWMCRYGCNQRDDNRYYRVNPTHPADLGGVIPLASICDEGKAASVTGDDVSPVLFISRKRRSWITDSREIEIRPSIPEYSRLWFLIWARPSIVETMRRD